MIDSLVCILVRLAGGALCRVPPSVAVWFGACLGRLACWLQPKRTRIGLRNLRAAFNGQLRASEARRIIRTCYQELGAGFIELLRLPVIDRAYMQRYLTLEGTWHFEEAATSGRPVILLTGHYGNWELSSIVAALRGRPIVALARAQDKLPKLYKLLVSYRESKGCTIVHKGGAMKRLIAALEQRRMVGIVGDQASRQGLFVEFFGRPALFATGPFELAYSKDALIVPAFIQRIRGPFHRIVVEPPMTLSRQIPKEEAIRQGIERFAQALSRHIAEEPSQWLWMHKRWKHTPARRILILSDGKAGHLKQSSALVEVMRERCPSAASHVVDVRYRSAMSRALALLWSWWMPRGLGAVRCLQWALTAESAQALLSRYADVIVSCGASTAPVNVLWSDENGAKSVVIMNPAPLPLGRFSLVIAPQHDRLPNRSNVVQTAGAVNRLREEDLQQARQRLEAHPSFRPQPPGVSGNGPAQITPTGRAVIGVFIGGDALEYEVSAAFADGLITQVMAACEQLDGSCLVTTSRRTSPAVERILAERLADDPRCRLLLLASRDPLNGTMEGMLGWADLAVVTGESISMVSEACASGRRVLVVEPPRRRAARSTPTKHRRFLRHLVDERYARLVPVPDLALTIQRMLAEPHTSRRLDNLSTVREAVGRLL